MGQSLKMTEPTIFALRKNAYRNDNNEDVPEGTLYEHLFGYDPIRVLQRGLPKQREDIQKGSAENPQLNILNPGTNFMVMELASEEQDSH